MVVHHILDAFAVLVSLTLMTAAPLGARTDPTPDPGAATREGNVYGFERHQPTPEVLGAAPPTAAAAEAVDREVRRFLKRIDALDRKAEEMEHGRR